MGAFRDQGCLGFRVDWGFVFLGFRCRLFFFFFFFLGGGGGGVVGFGAGEGLWGGSEIGRVPS